MNWKLILIISVLVLVVLYLFTFVVAPLTGEVIRGAREESIYSQKLSEEIKEYQEENGARIDSYEISVKDWNRNTLDDPIENPELFNDITTIGNKIIINQVFVKPTPCTKMNYTIIQEERLRNIHIIPKIIPPENPETVCASVMDYDEVEIIITVNEKAGSYGINLHHFEDEINPFLSQKVVF